MANSISIYFFHTHTHTRSLFSFRFFDYILKYLKKKIKKITCIFIYLIFEIDFNEFIYSIYLNKAII